jgi:hypothetical protein
VQEIALDTTVDRMQLQVKILAIPGVDASELDSFGLQLSQRLREVEVDSVRELPPEESPRGTKVAEPITFTSLVVVLLPALLPKVIDVVRDLLKDRRDGQVQLRIGGISVMIPHDASSADIANAAATLKSAAEKAGSRDEQKTGAADRK